MIELSPILSQKVVRVALSSERLSRPTLPKGSRIEQAIGDELGLELESTHRKIREVFGYKRLDLTVDISEPDQGRITTPDFDYQVSVSASSDHRAELKWIRELSLRSEGIPLSDSRLISVFGEELETITLFFSAPIDIAQMVDRVESRETRDIQIDYDMRCTWCELSLKEIPAIVRCEPQQVRISRQPGTVLSLPEIYALILNG